MQGHKCHGCGDGARGGCVIKRGKGLRAEGVKEEITHAKDAKDAKTGGLRICEGG